MNHKRSKTIHGPIIVIPSAQFYVYIRFQNLEKFIKLTFNYFTKF